MSVTRKQESGVGWLKRMVELLRGGALGVCAALVVLGVATVLVRGGMLSGDREGSAVIAACLLGGFVGGISTVWRRGTMALPMGLGAGAVLFLILLTSGVLLHGALPVPRAGGVVAAACLCGGGLAGVLGRSGGKKRRRR